MELNKCKCGKQTGKIDNTNDWYIFKGILKCVYCSQPYPDPSAVISEALELIKDKHQYLDMQFPGELDVIYPAKQVDDFIDHLKQILEKWDQGRE